MPSLGVLGPRACADSPCALLDKFYWTLKYESQPSHNEEFQKNISFIIIEIILFEYAVSLWAN